MDWSLKRYFLACMLPLKLMWQTDMLSKTVSWPSWIKFLIVVSLGLVWACYLTYVFVPKVYRMQFAYMVFENPYPEYNALIEGLLSSRVIDLTHMSDVRFICYASAESSASSHAEEYAELNQVPYNSFFYMIDSPNLRSLYLVDIYGQVKIISYIDEYRNVIDNYLYSSENFQSFTGSNLCFPNTNPIHIIFDDT